MALNDLLWDQFGQAPRLPLRASTRPTVTNIVLTHAKAKSVWIIGIIKSCVIPVGFSRVNTDRDER